MCPQNKTGEVLSWGKNSAGTESERNLLLRQERAALKMRGNSFTPPFKCGKGASSQQATVGSALACCLHMGSDARGFWGDPSSLHFQHCITLQTRSSCFPTDHTEFTCEASSLSGFGSVPQSVSVLLFCQRVMCYLAYSVSAFCCLYYHAIHT